MVVINTLLFLVNFLKTLIFVVLFYYLFKFLFRVLAPLFGFQKVNRQGGQQQRSSQRTEGEVRVENAQRRKSKFGKDDGEYVEFEEVD